MPALTKRLKPKREGSVLSSTDLRLTIVARLLALEVTKGLSQLEAARILDRAGMNYREIAEVLGTNPDVISVRLAEARRKVRARKNK